MAQGAAAYNKLTKVDNPVIDSFRYWGGVIGKRNEASQKANQERRTNLANQYREWTKANGVNDEMFKTMITENATFDTQYYNAATQVKDLYTEAYREGTENYWDIGKRNKSEAKMKAILSNFKSLETVGEVIAKKLTKAPEILQDPNYDRELNGEYEDLSASVLSNKNAQIVINRDNYQPEIWYPSSDGSLKKVTVPALTSGQILDPIMRTDGNKMSKDIIDQVTHKVESSMSGLYEENSDKWYDTAQKFYEEAFKSKLDDRTMASLYKDNVNKDSRKISGFTDEEREEVWNAFKDRGEVFFAENYSKKFNKEAVSIRNTDAKNAVTREGIKSKERIAGGQLALGYAKLSVDQGELELKKDIFESGNNTYLTPMATTQDKGATKKGTNYINLGLPKGMKVPTDLTYKTTSEKDGVKSTTTNKYKEVEVRGFNAVKNSNGTWSFAAEYKDTTIPYKNPSAIAAAAGYKSTDDMYRALDAAEYEANKIKNKK